MDSLKTDGIEAVTRYLDAAGLVQSLFNIWTRSTSEGATNGVAGSVTVLVLDNESTATVKSSAQLNQNLDWRDATENPHVNNGVPAEPGGSTNIDEQTVDVSATVTIQMLTLTGIFDWAATLGELGYTTINIDPEFSLSPVGSSGSKGGVGGAIGIFVITNDVEAVIHDGVAVYSAADGTMRVKAAEVVLMITIAQAGGSGGTFAVNGTFIYVGQTSNILAHVQDGVTIDTNDLNVYAGSLTTGISWAGSVTTSGKSAIGVSGAVNNVDRTVEAVIGTRISATDALYPLNDPVPPTTPGPGITAAGIVVVRALNDGQIYAFSVAGSATGGSSGDSTKEETDDPLDGVSLPILFGDVAPSRGPPASGNGIGIAGAVGITIVSDTTLSYISTSAPITATDLTVEADNKTWLLSVTGGAVLARPSGDGAPSQSSAIAGAFSLIIIDQTTRALVFGPVLDISGDMTVSATRDGFAITLSIGAAGNFTGGKTTIAGNISVNVLTSATEAIVDSVTGSVDGGMAVEATDGLELIAIGGGIAVGGKTGIGASVGANVIDADVVAALRSDHAASSTAATTNLTIGGALRVVATNDKTLRSVSVAAAGAQTAVAFTISINVILGDTTASIDDSTIDGPASAEVRATDDSNLQALGGSLAIGLGGNGFGGALGYNQVSTETKAWIADSTVTGVTGTVDVKAQSTETDSILDGKILSLSVGAAGSASAAAGGGLSINVVTSTVEATIQDSTVTAAGTVTVEVTDSSTIKSLAGGAGIGTGGAGVGIAIGVNVITADVTATILDSTVTTTGTGNVLVYADEGATIESISLGLGGGSSVGVAGSLSINVMVTNATASIDGDSMVDAAGTVHVRALHSGSVGVIAGQVSVGGTAGVGASITNADLFMTTTATISGSAEVDAGTAGSAVTDIYGNSREGVVVEAQTDTDVAVFAVGGSVGGTAGVAGSLALTIIDQTTTASIADRPTDAPEDAGITSASDVAVLAETTGQLIGGVGAIAIGGTAGVGIGADVGVMTVRVTAEIGEDAQVRASRHVIVDARNDTRIISVSISGAGGGVAAVALTAGVSAVNLTTKALIGADATVLADGNVVVSAEDLTRVDLVAGSIAGGGTAAIGVAAGIGVLTKHTEAAIEAGATVTALGRHGTVTVNSGALTDTSTESTEQQATEGVDFTSADVDVAANTISGTGLGGGLEVVYQADSLPVGGLGPGPRTTPSTPGRAPSG